MHKRTKMFVASVLALTTIAPAFATFAPMTVSAGQILGETSFEHKALPWHTCESSPAKQEFKIEDGKFHITVLVPAGGDGEKWDLQFRYRNLDFKAGNTYHVSFKVKGKRKGMELCSKIGNIKGDEEYFELDGKENNMHMGPAMGGQWPDSVKLTGEWQEFEGDFTPTKDLEGVEWAFHYAKGTKYQGNAEEGDELWFDDMSITCDSVETPPEKSYGATNRDWAGRLNKETMLKDGKTINFISVNQVGYYTDLQKIATLGDNKGDILFGATTIDLDKGSKYTWELVDATSGTAVESGETTAVAYDKESHDNVAKIDFSSFKTPGRYYLRIKGQDWRSFEFNIGDDIYTDKSHNMLTNALNYFYQNRSGIDIDGKYITSGDTSTLAHKGGHKTDKASVQTIWKNEYASKDEATSKYASSTITANGGWYDAGDHGKYVVNGGISVWTLQNMFERAQYSETTKKKFEDGSGTMVIPEAGNKIPDVLDECAFELDFMTQMKVDKSEPTWGKYAGMVYHKLHDHKWTGLATKPWDYESEWGTVRIVKPPTFAATLNYAACAAQAARLWEPYDAKKAAFYLDEAKAAYDVAKANWYAAADDEEYNETSLYAPMYQAKGGGPYGDNEVKDDLYWAACEIFVSAKTMKDADADKFQKELEDYKNAYQVTTRITGGENAVGEGSFTTFNWGNTASAGSLTLALHKDLLSEANQKILNDSILKAAKEYIECEEAEGYGIPYKYDGPGYKDPNNLPDTITIYGYEWGSNSMVINNLMVLAYAYDLTGEKDYMNGVVTGMNYLLGNNPLSFSYVTGYGTYKEQNPHHRYWSYELDKTLPMAPDGVLSGGPNAGLQDPYVRALGFEPGEKDVPSERCFVDSIEAWSTNEVTINWNAPLAWIVEFLQDKDVKYTFPGGSAPVSNETTTPEVDPPLSEADWGNVDCSEGATPAKRVDVADAVLLAKFLAEDKDAKVTTQGQLNADVNASGKPDSEDTIKILKFIAKLIDYSELGKK